MCKRNKQKQTMLARLSALRNHTSGSRTLIATTAFWRRLSTMALNLTGTCTCKRLQYTVKLESADQGRTTLCHCSSCKKAFGTNYGLTSKVIGPHPCSPSTCY